MSTLKFQVRSTQLAAWYAPSGASSDYYSSTANDAVPPSVQSSVLTGVFGGFLINTNPNAAPQKAVTYKGFSNTPSTNARSYLVRVVPNASGAPSTTAALFSFGWSVTAAIAENQCYITTAGKIFFEMYYQNGGNAISVLSNAFTWVANTPTDILITWDGTTGASGVNFYQDGTLNFSGAANANSQTPNANNSGIISLAYTGSEGSASPAFLFNEFAIWEGVVAITYPRSAFITAPNFDGTLCTDPGIAEVNSGINYFINGINMTGTLVQVTNITTKLLLQANPTAPVQTLILTQGDALTMDLLFTDNTGSAFNLTGATLTFEMLNSDNTLINIPNSQFTILNQTTNTGEVNMFLNGTTNAKVGIRTVIAKYTNGTSILQFRGQFTVLTSKPS